MRKRFKGILSVLVVICILVNATTMKTARAYDTIAYWESNGNAIGTWTYTPTIGKKFLGDNGSTPSMGPSFDSAYSIAKDEWASAGRPSNNYSGNIRYANIACYGGTKEQMIQETGINITDVEDGLTVYSATFLSFLSYNGAIKRLLVINSGVKVLIAHLYGAEADEYTNLMLHEMGHAMGWFGHSNNEDDVMFEITENKTELTFRDKRHIIQV